MKRNLLFVLLLSLIICIPANAEVMKARAVGEISTTSPKEFISVRLSRDFVLDSETTLKENTVLTGKMLDIVKPDKWHQNASFTFIPTSYTDADGTVHEITKEIRATYRQKIKPVSKEWGVGVGDLYFSPSYVTNTKRMINGETKEVFDEFCDKTTPWGRGIQVDIKPDEVIYFNFPD